MFEFEFYSPLNKFPPVARALFDIPNQNNISAGFNDSFYFFSETFNGSASDTIAAQKQDIGYKLCNQQSCCNIPSLSNTCQIGNSVRLGLYLDFKECPLNGYLIEYSNIHVIEYYSVTSCAVLNEDGTITQQWRNNYGRVEISINIQCQ